MVAMITLSGMLQWKLLKEVELMLKPRVRARDFEKFGFKRCKGIPKSSECYYLCIARGMKMLFVSDYVFAINVRSGYVPVL